MMGDLLIAADVLRNYADPVIAKHVDLDHLEPEPTQNFGKTFQELVQDIAFVSHLIDKKRRSEILIVAEHKSVVEPFVSLQLLVYLSLTWYRRWNDAGRPQSTKTFRLPSPILIVLYNGKGDWKSELNIKDLVASVPPELEPFIPEIRILSIRLNQFDLRNLPGRPETQAVIESMIRATNGTFVSGLESVLGRFRDTTLDGRIRELIEDIIHYCDWVAEVTPDDVDKAIKKGIPGEKGIEMSQAVKGIWATLREEGEIKKGREMLLKILRARFQNIPAEVEQTIQSMNDPTALDSWAEHALTCQSMTEFSEAIR
jgi:hypothetical protein